MNRTEPVPRDSFCSSWPHCGPSPSAATGRRSVRLDTNRSLTAAIDVPARPGELEVDAFNDEPYTDHWFEKHL